jgi:hypothetical protein
LLEHWTGARLELAQHDNIGRERALFDDRLEIGLKSVPLLLVDEEFEHRAGLVPSGRVVVLGMTVESE